MRQPVVPQARRAYPEIPVHLCLRQLRHEPDRVRILQPEEEQDEERPTGLYSPDLTSEALHTIVPA